MKLQVLQDSFGENTGVFIPMTDWTIITNKHQDLKDLIDLPKSKIKISDLVGLLTEESSNELIQEVKESRKSWDIRNSKQF